MFDRRAVTQKTPEWLRRELLCLHLDSTWGIETWHGVPSLPQDSSPKNGKDRSLNQHEPTIEDSQKQLSVRFLNFLMQSPVKKCPLVFDADVREKHFSTNLRGWWMVRASTFRKIHMLLKFAHVEERLDKSFPPGKDENMASWKPPQQLVRCFSRPYISLNLQFS